MKIRHARYIPMATKKKDKGGKDIIKGLKKNPALAIVLVLVVVAVVYILASNQNNSTSGTASQNAQNPDPLAGVGGAYILQGESGPSVVNNYPQSLHTKHHHVTAHGGHEHKGGKHTKKPGGTTHSHGGKTHTHIGGHKPHKH